MQDERERYIEISKWLTELGVNWDGKVTDLQSLNLRGKQITSLPESIFQGKGCANGKLTNLHTLILNSNQLTSIPKSIGKLINLQYLILWENQLTSIPQSIGQLTKLQTLSLSKNQLTSLPNSICQLTKLQGLYLDDNRLTELPKSIGKLTHLLDLHLNNNQLTELPQTIDRLTDLQHLYINNNPLTDLSPLAALKQEDLEVYFLGVRLPRRYWRKFSNWQPEWLLDEHNAEVRRVLIQQVGYEKICDRLGAEEIDSWREYTLLKIDNIQAVYEEYEEEPIDWEPLVMLKMTCPSTGHIHILRVPPEMTSAEAAITWVNHGIHPDDIAVQT